MLTCDIKVNGRRIATISAVNQGKKGITLSEFELGWRKYLYKYDNYEPKQQLQGSVHHFRPSGAIALIKEICEDLETKGA